MTYKVNKENAIPEYVLNFTSNSISNYLYHPDYQNPLIREEFIRKNDVSLKSFEMFKLGDLLSINYYAKGGERQFLYDMKNDTIVGNCNYLVHLGEKLPISFYWFPKENNINQVISFYTSENIAEMDKETQAIFQQKIGKPINENDNPILVILEKK